MTDATHAVDEYYPYTDPTSADPVDYQVKALKAYGADWTFMNSTEVCQIFLLYQIFTFSHNSHDALDNQSCFPMMLLLNVLLITYGEEHWPWPFSTPNTLLIPQISGY